MKRAYLIVVHEDGGVARAEFADIDEAATAFNRVVSGAMGPFAYAHYAEHFDQPMNACCPAVAPSASKKR